MGVRAEHVAEAEAAHGGELAEPAHVGNDAVVDAFGGKVFEFGIVEATDVGQAADAHLDEPAVDHEVAGDVPEVGVASVSTVAVGEANVEHFVGDNETALLLREANAADEEPRVCER